MTKSNREIRYGETIGRFGGWRRTPRPAVAPPLMAAIHVTRCE